MTWKYATNISTSWCYCRLFSWATRLKRRPRQCLYSILRDNENSCDDGRLALCDVVVKRLRTKQHDISTFASPTILVYLRDYERSPTDRPTGWEDTAPSRKASLTLLPGLRLPRRRTSTPTGTWWLHVGNVTHIPSANEFPWIQNTSWRYH